jgi:multiple sugar transport system substrate-binding protein
LGKITNLDNPRFPPAIFQAIFWRYARHMVPVSQLLRSIPMSKRVLTAVLLLVLALGLGVSLVGAQGDVVVTWRTRPDNQAEIDVYTSLSESIDARLDGVSLEYQAGGTETAGYQDTLLAELSAGTAPDIFWIPGTDIARFASRGVIGNLAEIAAADADFDVNVFYPQQVEQLTYNPDEMMADAATALWGLPRDASSFALYVNLDLFEAAGVATPAELMEEGNWTWETFQETVVAIGELGDDVAGFGMNAWWANWWAFFQAAGGDYFNEDRTACALNSPEVNTALNFLVDLYGTGEAVPFGTDSEPPFIAGNVGMFLNGRWATPNTLAQAEFNWDYAEVPMGPAGQGNWLFWGAYVVSASALEDEARAAAIWSVLKELTSVESQSLVTALGANIPSRAGEDAVAAFLASVEGKNNAAFTNALANYAQPEFSLWTGDWASIDSVVSGEVTKVVNGEISPDDFSAAICDQVDPLFN